MRYIEDIELQDEIINSWDRCLQQGISSNLEKPKIKVDNQELNFRLEQNIYFIERLKSRIKKEKIKDPNLLTEIIIDELFIIYVNDEVL